VVVRSNSEHLENLEEYSYLRKRVNNLLLVKTMFEHMLNDRSNGRKMFNVVTKTWNPVTGCLHNCSYCWAKDLATTKLKNSNRYKKGFCPHLNKEEFRGRFAKGDFIFVSDMGDLFGDFIPDEWISEVIEHTKRFPQTYFLFLTKNPSKYEEFLDNMPMNAILGTTIETNRDKEYVENAVSGAPLPSARYTAMKRLEWDKKFISIEPILDFDFDVFLKWTEEISPFMVYVGYDNYFKRLPEPPLSKTTKFVEELSKLTLVVKKSIRPAWFESLALTGE